MAELVSLVSGREGSKRPSFDSRSHSSRRKGEYADSNCPWVGEFLCLNKFPSSGTAVGPEWVFSSWSSRKEGGEGGREEQWIETLSKLDS